VKEASVPTLVDHLTVHLQEHLTRPDFVERMKPLEAACERVFGGFFEQIGAALQRVAESPPSPGYEPWLVERGYDPILARMMAALVVRRGNRIAQENARLQAAVDAIRFLAKPGRNRRAIARRVAEALASYDNAIALKPHFADAFNNRGLALQELKRIDEALASYDSPEEAVASFDKAIALNPDYAEAFNNRGVTLQELKRLDEALASYDRALSLRPKEPVPEICTGR
jgi:tetratricopeptide (TPR) repeat protein